MQFPLSEFIANLFESGNVTVAGEVAIFNEEDLTKSVEILEKFYENDLFEMPEGAPPFHSESAIWGAKFLYHSVQLIMLRNLDTEFVTTLLTDYPDVITPEVIYSVDLCLRYLPDLTGLAKGLAPDDLLVKRLNEIALNWPLSSASMKIPAENNLQPILNYLCLRTLYIDRIIAAGNLKKIDSEEMHQLTREVLGKHGKTLWEEYNEPGANSIPINPPIPS